ncbi:hypothetical protein [Levilactobacillus enshiensis]|uniref:hypothetical protein n=1 Tax=Levilactobacillus enshiensis TaxID=2590213 RepID=UPI00117B5F2F|nr:hypothetical protein [Levilactobacillus enshiensis]
MSSSKVKGVIAVLVVLVLGVETVKIIRMPHHLTTAQILQRFSWHVDTKDGSAGVAKFSKTLMKVTDAQTTHKYRYVIDDYNQVLRIKSGSLKGKYDMKMDTIDYKLVPEKASHRKSKSPTKGI